MEFEETWSCSYSTRSCRGKLISHYGDDDDDVDDDDDDDIGNNYDNNDDNDPDEDVDNGDSAKNINLNSNRIRDISRIWFLYVVHLTYLSLSCFKGTFCKTNPHTIGLYILSYRGTNINKSHP